MQTQNNNLALDKAIEMMGIPMKDLPAPAIEYKNHLASRVGLCSEVCITAYAYYNQAVLKMPCNDDLYIIPAEEREWFVKNKYCS